MGVDTLVRNYPVLLRRYQRLMEISRTLPTKLDLPHLLEIIIQAAAELTDSEVASIFLIDPRTGELRFEATTNLGVAEMDKIVVPKDSSIAGWTFMHSEPVIIAEVSKDPRWNKHVDAETDFVTRSLMGVPLTAQDETIGVLQALNKRDNKAFTNEDVTTLQALAAHAAVAIVNARLFQQSDLIAEMVHELRTPLAALTATSHLLQRPDLPADKRAGLIRTIEQETNRLAAMTTDFLDLAKLESGRARFVREPFDLAALIGECAEFVLPQANDRQITIELAVAQEFPRLHGDRGKIKQVVLNLLTNAIKYNIEGGRIYVRASIAENEGRARVSVRDTGRGISANDLPRIFEKFYRVPDSEGAVQGTGLGLSIAKRIVETHGGQMLVESELDQGTQFTFTIPLASTD